MNKRFFLVLLFIIWLLVLFGFFAFKQFTVSTGTKILLETMPIDPRDLLRGDYVVLNYKISRLDTSKIPCDTNIQSFSRGDKIYVVLKKDGNAWSAQEIKKRMPAGNPVFIKGTLWGVYPPNLHLSYGIESYFVPEGQGRNIETYRGNNLTAEVITDKFGNAVLNKLFIDNKEIKFR